MVQKESKYFENTCLKFNIIKSRKYQIHKIKITRRYELIQL